MVTGSVLPVSTKQSQILKGFGFFIEEKMQIIYVRRDITNKWEMVANKRSIHLINHLIWLFTKINGVS